LIAGFRTVAPLLLLFVLGGCATLPDNSGRSHSFIETNTADTGLGRAVAAQRRGRPDQSGFLLLQSGLDALVARAALARAAERTIDAQYYLLHPDLTGRLFINELLQAAERGVRVRLLIDDMDLAGRDINFAALDAHPHVQVRIFNPFGRDVGRLSQLVTRFGSVTRRMHNKSFTVDSQAVILGGRNIGDEYFEANPALAFGDLDVLGFGPIAQKVGRSFDQYWNHPLAYPVTVLLEDTPSKADQAVLRRGLETFVAEQADSAYLRALRDSRLTQQLVAGELPLTWGQASVVADDPEKLLADRSERQLHLVDRLTPHFEDLSSELTIFSPYFVPTRKGVDFLTGLVTQGVRVRVLTNSLASTDVPVVHAGYARYRRELLRAGVELFEVNRQWPPGGFADKWRWSGSSKASLHAKSFVLDRERVFIGSLNFDPRSVIENTEIGVVIDAPPIAFSMADWFDRNIEEIAFRVTLESDDSGIESLRWRGYEKGEPVVYQVEPYTSFWQRGAVNLLRLLPIESQL